jgi:hypothetical protein
VAAAVAKGFNVIETDYEGNTCLHLAVKQRSDAMVRMLLEGCGRKWGFVPPKAQGLQNPGRRRRRGGGGSEQEGEQDQRGWGGGRRMPLDEVAGAFAVSLACLPPCERTLGVQEYAEDYFIH